jgi:AcrR family transcriptional regulator
VISEAVKPSPATCKIDAMTGLRSTATPHRKYVKPPLTQRFLNKREAVLDAAARCFNRDGLKGATFAEVARNVGLVTHSVTYYYRRKEDLAEACMLRAIAASRDVAIAAMGAGNPEQRIRTYLRGCANLLAEIAVGERRELVSFSEIRALPAAQADVAFAAYTEMFRSVRLLLPDTKEFDRAKRNARTHLLLSLANGMRGWIGRYEASDYVQVADRVGDVLVRGLAQTPCLWREPTGPELGWPQAVAGRDGVPDSFLRAATFMVNELGYRGASLDKIAAKLNLTKGSLYHHYASKEQLIAACFERTFGVIRQAQLLAMDRKLSGFEKLCATARTLVRFHMSEQGPLLRLNAWSSLPIAPRTDMRNTFDRLTERFGTFIVQGMMEGSIAVLDQSIAAQLVALMINAASELERWVPNLTPDSAIPLYVRPLFTGILSSTARSEF